VIIAIKKLSHFCASCLKIAPAATLGEVVKQPKKNLPRKKSRCGLGSSSHPSTLQFHNFIK